MTRFRRVQGGDKLSQVFGPKRDGGPGREKRTTKKGQQVQYRSSRVDWAEPISTGSSWTFDLLSVQRRFKNRAVGAVILATVALGIAVPFMTGSPTTETAVESPMAKAPVEAPKPSPGEWVFVPVSSVRSLEVEFIQRGLEEAETQLESALSRRSQQIEALLEQMSEVYGANGRPAQRRALLADLHKTPEQIASHGDSRWVGSALRRDVRKWVRTKAELTQELEKAETAWARHDEHISGGDVESSLASVGLTAASLKALLGQESGDFTIDDRHGNIRGIAQAGSVEANKAGRHLNRDVPADAVVIAARTLSDKVAELQWELSQLDLDWQRVRNSDDYPSFAFASYNAGAHAIAMAMAEAHARGLDYTSWSALTEVSDGASDSPLHYALSQIRMYKNRAGQKTEEATAYVSRIEQRLGRPSRPSSDHII